MTRQACVRPLIGRDRCAPDDLERGSAHAGDDRSHQPTPTACRVGGDGQESGARQLLSACRPIGRPEVLVPAAHREEGGTVRDLIGQLATEPLELARDRHLLAILAATDEDKIRLRQARRAHRHLLDLDLDRPESGPPHERRDIAAVPVEPQQVRKQVGDAQPIRTSGRDGVPQRGAGSASP